MSEVFRLTAKQEKKPGSYKLLRFLCSQKSPFPLLCSSGQPDLVLLSDVISEQGK